MNHREPRRAVDLSVRLRDFSWSSIVDENAGNLSRGGAFIHMAEPFSEGTLVKFVIQAPGDRTIAGAGRVAWRRFEGEEENAPSGIGLKFINISDDGITLIDDILDGIDTDAIAKFSQMSDSKPKSDTDVENDAENDVEAEQKVIVAAKAALEAEERVSIKRAERAKSGVKISPILWILGLVVLVGLLWTFYSSVG